MITTVLSIYLILLVFCVLLLWKNNINYSIRIKWLDDVYESVKSQDGKYKWSDIPHYDKTFLDFTLWKYKPLDKYLKNKSK